MKSKPSPKQKVRKVKALKFIYALVCNGHWSVNDLFSTKLRAQKEAKDQYHKKCHTQVVAVRLD